MARKKIEYAYESIQLKKGLYMRLISGGTRKSIGSTIPSGMLIHINFEEMLKPFKKVKSDTAALSFPFDRKTTLKLATKMKKAMR